MCAPRGQEPDPVGALELIPLVVFDGRLHIGKMTWEQRPFFPPLHCLHKQKMASDLSSTSGVCSNNVPHFLERAATENKERGTLLCADVERSKRTG